VSTSASVSVPTKQGSNRESSGRDRLLRSVSLADGVFVCGVVTLLGYAFWLGRDLTFFSDDWDIIAFHHNGAYLTPYNGHLWLVPIGIFHTLYVTAGLGSYTPYRAVGLVGYAALAIVLFAYARQRVSPILAALASLSIAWYSTAQFDVLFPLLVNFSIPLAATVLIWIFLDRATFRSDLAAGGCLAVALSSSSIGLITVAAVGTELLLLRAPFRRWVPFVPPFALWLLWYVIYRTPTASPGSMAALVRYSLHEIQATFAGFAAGSNAGGYLLMAAVGGVFTLSIIRWRTFNARAAGALAAIASFAVLTSYTRAGFIPPVPPTTPRYLWLNAFFVVAALIEVVRGRRLSPLVAVVAAVIVAVGSITLVSNLRSYHGQVIAYKHSIRTFLVATEAIPDRINRRRVIPVSYIPVRAGDYLAAVRHLGSPIVGLGLNDLGSERDRSTADGWMIHDLGLHFVPLASAPAGRCSAVPPVTAEHGLVVRGPTTVILQGGTTAVSWSIRRLARRFSAPHGQTLPHALEGLSIPADHSSFPWHLRIKGQGIAVSLCR
jgi:hypothetical protein